MKAPSSQILPCIPLNQKNKMGIPVFYLENPETNQFLSTEDSYHSCKVLRMKAGDSLHLLNGNGKKFAAKIIESDSKKTAFHQLELITEVKENPNTLHLWIAPTKQMERMEWMVEKCTEIGIASFGFFYSKNSERKEIKLSRLEKIIVSAMKQSKQLFIPKLIEMQALNQLVNGLKNEKVGFAYISSDTIPPIQALVQTNAINHVLIGPEGDFTNQEIDLFLKAGFRPFSLGKSILRTETAGLITCAAFALNN